MALIRSFNSNSVVIQSKEEFKSNFTVIWKLCIRICIVVWMDMKACWDGRYKRSKQCYCVLSRVSCLSTLLIWRSKHSMHLMLCLSTVLTLVFVALTQHLIQSTMRCENCINSINIDSMVEKPRVSAFQNFLQIENPLNIKKVMGRNVWMCFVSTVST